MERLEKTLCFCIIHLISFLWYHSRHLEIGKQNARGVVGSYYCQLANHERHWPVFWASFAVVLVTWGVVPIQAGIFSVRTVTRTTNTTFSISTSIIPFDQQATTLTFRYTQSAYGIAALNETLPPYMARNYTLAPFKASLELDNISKQGTLTAPTTMYSLDLYCEDASRKGDDKTVPIAYVNKNGCNVTGIPTGNDTVGNNKVDMYNRVVDMGLLNPKQYSGIYIGYHNGGFADWYLSGFCPTTANTTFFAALQRNKVRNLSQFIVQ
jgi:hypothetical protein